MSALQFQQLPVAPDDGLPQAFSCTVGPTDYDFGVYANMNIADEDLPETIYDLAPADGLVQPVSSPGYLVLSVVRQGPAGPEPVLLRKLVAEPGLVHYTGELALTLTKAKVARGNLNGVGHYGTEIVIGVALRWA